MMRELLGRVLSLAFPSSDVCGSQGTRLSELEGQVVQLTEDVHELEGAVVQEIDDLRSQVNEWAGVKGFSKHV